MLDYFSPEALNWYAKSIKDSGKVEEKPTFGGNDILQVSYSTAIFRDYYLSQKISLLCSARNIIQVEKVQSMQFNQLNVYEFVQEVLDMNASEIEDN